MKRISTILLLLALALGCATTRPPVTRISYTERQEGRLDAAVHLIEMGDSTRATNLLRSICADPGVVGVTDEALFRLSILQLRSRPQTGGPQQCRETLERLQREYPESSWAKMASTLLEVLSAKNEPPRADPDLESRNLILIRENERLTRDVDALRMEVRELREKLEKLKHLDLELEDESR